MFLTPRYFRTIEMMLVWTCGLAHVSFGIDGGSPTTIKTIERALVRLSGWSGEGRAGRPEGCGSSFCFWCCAPACAAGPTRNHKYHLRWIIGVPVGSNFSWMPMCFGNLKTISRNSGKNFRRGTSGISKKSK